MVSWECHAAVISYIIGIWLRMAARVLFDWSRAPGWSVNKTSAPYSSRTYPYIWDFPYYISAIMEYDRRLDLLHEVEENIWLDKVVKARSVELLHLGFNFAPTATRWPSSCQQSLWQICRRKGCHGGWGSPSYLPDRHWLWLRVHEKFQKCIISGWLHEPIISRETRMFIKDWCTSRHRPRWPAL